MESSRLSATLKGLGKMMLLSRPASLRKDRANKGRTLVVMGNGPSLRTVIDEHADFLAQNDTLAVNFAANAPEFRQLKPKYYVMADPFFFGDDYSHDNLRMLHSSLAAVDWPMTLIVPVKFAGRIPAQVLGNSHITVRTMNDVGVEGFGWFRRLAYGSRLAMPRPRNVLIASIMAGIWLGYGKLVIVGADHSWMQTIRVDDRNRVVSVQPHFYNDSKAEQKRVDTAYAGYRLHQIVYSFYVAFSSYHLIADFARHRGVEIVNATPDSYIDAFERIRR